MPGVAQNARRARLDAATIAAFALCVGAPAVDLLVRPVEARLPHAERRAAAQMPPFPRTFRELETFPQAFEARFLDTFGLRDALLGANSLVLLEVFRRSPVKRALLGRDGWMFLARGRATEELRGLAPLSASALDTLCDALEARRASLEARGIRYLAVVVPNKETVHPEFLPERTNKVGPTRLEQLDTALRERRFDAWLDLRAPFAAARAAETGSDAHSASFENATKRENASTSADAAEGAGAVSTRRGGREALDREPLYEPLGTHWSPRGALVAYRAIVERLRALAPAIADEPRLELAPAPELEDSYARTMYLAWRYPKTPRAWAPVEARARVLVERRRFGGGSTRTTAIDDPRLPRALFLHDSFGPHVERALAEHVSQLVCVWRNDLDETLLASARPNVVIDLIVERRIGAWFTRGAVDEE